MNAGVICVSLNRADLYTYEHGIGRSLRGHRGVDGAAAVAERHFAAVHAAIAVARGMTIGVPRVRGWRMVRAMTGRSSVLRMGTRAAAIERGVCGGCRGVDTAELSHRSGVTHCRYGGQEKQSQHFA